MTETVARGSTLFLRHSRNLYCAVTGAPGPDYSIHPACSQRQRCSLMTWKSSQPRLFLSGGCHCNSFCSSQMRIQTYYLIHVI